MFTRLALKRLFRSRFWTAPNQFLRFSKLSNLPLSSTASQASVISTSTNVLPTRSTSLNSGMHFFSTQTPDSKGNTAKESNNKDMILKLYAQAERGDDDAMLKLGIFYLAGYHGLPRDPKVAIKFFGQAASKDNHNAQFYLASIFLQNLKNTQKKSNQNVDPNGAIQLLRQASQGGHTKAQYTLGSMLLKQEAGLGYLSGESSKIENQQTVAEEGLEWLMKAADEGNDGRAQAILGEVFATAGSGVGAGAHLSKEYFNLDRAHDWLKRAAQQGEVEAMYGLGEMYKYRGTAGGVPEATAHDSECEFQSLDEKAVSWLTKAANSGHIKAQASLGFMYYHGIGVKIPEQQENSNENIEREQQITALQWLGYSAQNGSPDAMFMVGTIAAQLAVEQPNQDEQLKKAKSYFEQLLKDIQEEIKNSSASMPPEFFESLSWIIQNPTQAIDYIASYEMRERKKWMGGLGAILVGKI